MAVTKVKLQGSGRPHTLDALDGYKRTYQRRWIVETDNALENERNVMTANAAPSGAVALTGSTHPNDVRAFCVRKSAAQIGDKESERKVWMVTAFYETLKRDEQKRLVHPLDRPYEIDWAGETFQSIAEVDLDGDGIMNSAGQYFDPPLQVDLVRPVLTVTRNEATFDGSLAAQYQEAINTDEFQGGAPYTVKCKSIKAKRVIEEFTVDEATIVEVIFWTVTYEFHYWWRTWRLFPLDQGRYEVESGGDKLVPIQDSLGQNVTDPVPLDGMGHALPPGSLPESAVYLEFRYYRELPFSAFNFV